MKRTAAKLVFSLAVCGLVAPTVANAQGFTPLFPFIDDFQDGSASDDAPVSYIPGTTPATITMVNQDMVLTKPIQVASWSLGLTIVQKSGKALSSEDVSAQTVVRVSDSAAYAGIYMQGQAKPPNGDGGAIVGFIRGDGGITTGSYLVAPQQTLPTPLDPINNDVVLRVDSVGAKVTITAWAAGDPSLKYSLTVVGPVTRPPGFIGQCFGRSGSNPTGASATFRSFEVVAPPTLKIEPAIILSWPEAADGYALEGASDINGPWVGIAAEVRVLGEESTVALKANMQAQFYRLARP